MKNFARIIELDNAVQALLYYAYDHETEDDKVYLKIGLEGGGLFEMTFGYSNEEDARKALHGITKEGLQEIYNKFV